MLWRLVHKLRTEAAVILVLAADAEGCGRHFRRCGRPPHWSLCTSTRPHIGLRVAVSTATQGTAVAAVVAVGAIELAVSRWG
jgi:hypothetical protein